MRKVGFVIMGALATTALTAGLATAKGPHGKSTCTGTLASGKYHRLVVPAGATCDGTQANIDVRGGVRVGEGATFILGAEPARGRRRSLAIAMRLRRERGTKANGGVTEWPQSPSTLIQRR